MHTCVHTYKRTCTLAYISTYICTYVNTCIHMHLPTYIGKDDVLLGSPAGRELILGEGRANSKFALTSSLSPSCDRAAHGCSNTYVVIALAVPPARPVATSICMCVHMYIHRPHPLSIRMPPMRPVAALALQSLVAGNACCPR